MSFFVDLTEEEQEVIASSTSSCSGSRTAGGNTNNKKTKERKKTSSSKAKDDDDDDDSFLLESIEGLSYPSSSSSSSFASATFTSSSSSSYHTTTSSSSSPPSPSSSSSLTTTGAAAGKRKRVPAAAQEEKTKSSALTTRDKGKQKKKVGSDDDDDDDEDIVGGPRAEVEEEEESLIKRRTKGNAAPSSSSSSGLLAAPTTAGKKRKEKEREREEEQQHAKTSNNRGAAAGAKRRRKKTAPEEDVLVLLDANLLNEPGGDEYLTCLRSPIAKDKKPVLCDVRSLPIRNSIEWRTSFGAEDDESDIDEGLAEDERKERQKRNKTKVVDSVIVKYSGIEFGKLVRERSLKEEVDKIKAAHANKRITILVEGLKNFFSQETRRVNRELKGSKDSDSESEEYSDDDGVTNKSTRRVTRSMVADAIVWLQIEAKCHVRKSDNVAESANYVYRYTSAIANAPYKQESSFATFCAEATGKRSVKSATIGEIWIKQLQQLNKVSVAKATAIANSYPTFRSLMSVYQSNSLTNNQKEMLLQNIAVGTVGKERRIGPVISKRIYHFFTDEDGTRKVN